MARRGCAHCATPWTRRRSSHLCFSQQTNNTPAPPRQEATEEWIAAHGVSRAGMYGDGGGRGSFLPLWSTDTRSRDALYALPCKRFIAGIALYTVAQVMGRRAAVPHEDSCRHSAHDLPPPSYAQETPPSTSSYRRHSRPLNSSIPTNLRPHHHEVGP